MKSFIPLTLDIAARRRNQCRPPERHHRRRRDVFGRHVWIFAKQIKIKRF